MTPEKLWERWNELLHVERLVMHWPGEEEAQLMTALACLVSSETAALEARCAKAERRVEELAKAMIGLGHGILGCDGYPCRIEIEPLECVPDMLEHLKEIRRHEVEVSVDGVRWRPMTLGEIREEDIDVCDGGLCSHGFDPGGGEHMHECAKHASLTEAERAALRGSP